MMIFIFVAIVSDCGYSLVFIIFPDMSNIVKENMILFPGRIDLYNIYQNILFCTSYGIFIKTYDSILAMELIYTYGSMLVRTTNDNIRSLYNRLKLNLANDK